MNLGKVSQTVYRRSILKQLNTDENTALWKPGQEESCYGLRQTEGEKVLSCDVSLYGNEKDLCVFAIAQAVNHLASRGAEPKGVSIQIMLPDFAFESRLKAMIAAARQTAQEQGLQILAAESQVVPMIRTTIVHVTAVGTYVGAEVSDGTDGSAAASAGNGAEAGGGGLVLGRMAQADQDIVLINHIGLEGTLRIKRAKEAELSERFIPAFLNKIETYQPELFARREMRAATAIGVSAMHQIVDGGILAALWNLAEGAGIGLAVDLRKMTVRQETIEVCECFHLNPYQLTSAGCVLAVTPKGEELADTLNRMGMTAAVIGRTTNGNDRIIRNGEEKRFLDRPAPDELTRIFGE